MVNHDLNLSLYSLPSAPCANILAAVVKSNCSILGPASLMNISLFNLPGFSLFRTSVFKAFWTENLISQGAEDTDIIRAIFVSTTKSGYSSSNSVISNFAN